jgi:hypothetical protein
MGAQTPVVAVERMGMARTILWSAAERFPLPTGQELFSTMSVKEQEKAIGPEAAAAVREGADLKDFVGHSRLQSDTPDFITQRPVEDATTN